MPRPVSPEERDVPDLREQREAAERAAILQALQSTGGDKGRAAQLLGMARSTFYRRVKEFGL